MTKIYTSYNPIDSSNNICMSMGYWDTVSTTIDVNKKVDTVIVVWDKEKNSMSRFRLMLKNKYPTICK